MNAAAAAANPVLATRNRANIISSLGWRGRKACGSSVHSTYLVNCRRESRRRARTTPEATRIAEAQKARADRDFGAAKATIDHLIFDIAQGLVNAAGMPVCATNPDGVKVQGPTDKLP
jgi:hypothetical protein